MAKAEIIKERRKRAAKGRHFVEAKTVQLVALDYLGETYRLCVPQDPDLAATLCRILQCNILET